ncbi:hypothetical protein VNO77_16508 [Canavalia gladiata]|uniref:Uncharacterized protein n=1 Tax=Canavalia gladiata TaxID=3824 RepID=A0AAN9M5Z6_CANGL
MKKTAIISFNFVVNRGWIVWNWDMERLGLKRLQSFLGTAAVLYMECLMSRMVQETFEIVVLGIGINL